MKKAEILSLLIVGIFFVNSATAAVLARVGSKAITSEDVKREYQLMTGDQKKVVNKDIASKTGLVDSVVNAEILYQASVKAGLDKDKEYVKNLERFRRQYLASRFMKKNIEGKLVRSSIKKFYQKNRTLFDGTKVCAYHIVVQSAGEANSVAKKAMKKNAKFDKLALKHSVDPTVQENKGYLGCFTRDKMVPEFTAAAFSMRKNEIKGPIRTVYGHHIIKVVDIKAGKVPGFEEIEQRVKDTYRIKLVQDLLKNLRAKSKVKLNQEEIKKFSL